MIETYYIDVTQFENEALFREMAKRLSPYRQQKLARLKHEKDRFRSLGAGVALDEALKAYGLREQRMAYALGEWGKPSLQGQPGIHFSLSHSGDYAICSIGDSPLGNDIERIRTGRLKVADRFFAGGEREFIYAATEEVERTQRMFRIWTMKESFLKAIGRGISAPMGEFSIIVEETNGIESEENTYYCGKHVIRVEQAFDSVSYCMTEYQELPGYWAAVCYREGEETADDLKQIVL